MNTYNIKVFYQTGNSFGHEDTDMIVEGDWTDIECIKLSLKYIQEHYEMYKELNFYRSNKEDVINKYKDKYWFNKDCPKYSITLVLDNNKPWPYSCSWTGYFERLHSAEIICKEDTDMKFTI